MNGEVFELDRHAAELRRTLLRAMDESARAWAAFEAADLRRSEAARKVREYLRKLEGGAA